VGRFDADGFLAVVRCMLTTTPATGNISNVIPAQAGNGCSYGKHVIPAQAGKCHPCEGREWAIVRMRP
jgi:hypothetical protein